jgi:hypothetical protein
MSTTEVILSGAYQYEKSGEVFTVYSFFNTFNFTNQEAASSYALPFTPLVFKPRLNDVQNFLSRKRILWNFGDGTTSEAVTARHAYKNAGRYKVTCYLYDRNGNSYYDTFAQNVDIYNYITDTITISYPTTGMCLTSSKISNPIQVSRGTSFESYKNGRPALTIIPYASGSSDGTNYFDTGLANTYYSHLYPYSSFYLRLTGARELTEFVEISSFETSSIPIYCKLSGTEVVKCLRSDPGSFFCGTTGVQDVYFKTDFAAKNLNLMFGLQPGSLHKFVNTTTVGVSACVLENTDLNHLSITSNGLDGEGDTSTIFYINKNKFSNTDISFVVKVKDSQNFTIKSLPLITDINLIVTDGITTYPAVFKNNMASVAGLNSGGSYIGSATLNTNTTFENVFISAGVLLDGRYITGTSNTFNIYPSAGVCNIAKKGEDIDFTQTFKDISFQSLFLDNPVLFDEFLQNIFGTLSSEQTSPGKVTYEKIENFVNNNAVLDYANIDKLIALFKQYNINDNRFDSVNYRYPAAMARLVDILSIKRSKLFGTQNKFNEDFKTYGYTDSQIFGKNLGAEISLNQTITAGNSIVTFERFSGTFRLVNSFQPVSALSPTSKTYEILNYDDSWGWGLVLPEDGYGANISNYYFFYEHTPIINGTISDGIINFYDPNTTLQFTNSSYSNWAGADGLISGMLSNQLYKGLNLIK